MWNGTPSSGHHGKKARAALMRAASIAFMSGAMVVAPLSGTWHGSYPELAWHGAAADDKGGEGKGGSNRKTKSCRSKRTG